MSGIADKLREAQRYLLESECGWDRGECGTEPWGVCHRCAALAEFPDPDAAGECTALLTEFMNGKVGVTRDNYKGWRIRARVALAKLEKP